VSLKDLLKPENAQRLVAYRYLYWACSRGHLFVVDFIIKHFGISPFLAEKNDDRSPFMIAIENNQEKVVLLLLLKEFTYPPD